MFFHIFPHMLSGINPAYMTTYHIFVISYHSVIVTTNITNGKKNIYLNTKINIVYKFLIH
jgi:hypothetical protein